MNVYQKAVFKHYGGGDYAHATTENDISDTHALAIWRELADDGDEPMDRETAIRRMETMIEDTQAALRAVCYTAEIK